MTGVSGTTGSGWIAINGIIVTASAARMSGELQKRDAYLKSIEVLKAGLVRLAVPNTTGGKESKHE
jgi:hypothetical protein